MKLMPEAREKQKQKTKRCYNVGGGGIMCVISVIPVYLFIAPAACLPQPQTLFKKVSCGYGGINGCLTIANNTMG